MGSDQTISCILSAEERSILWHGLRAWGGPAACTDLLANAMGFASVESVLVEGKRISDSVRQGEALSADVWARASDN